jgi:RNA polymerase sigma-70 factor (ECF subfamily)
MSAVPFDPPLFSAGDSLGSRLAQTVFATLPAMTDKKAATKKRAASPAKPKLAAVNPGAKAAPAKPATPAAKPFKTPDAAPLIALFERIITRDEKALAKLYEQTIGRVYGLALRISRNEAAAEEIAEDVYLQVWKNAATYSAERGHPLAWMMVITRSRALDYLRREDPAESHPEPETLADYAEADNDPRDLLESMQDNTALHAAIAALPALQRQLLALAFFQGLSHSEIASHAQLPLGTVKTHLRRALQSLRAVLA